MRRTILLFAALAACCAAPASAHDEKSCGDLPGAVDAPQDVRVAGTTCAVGKALARRHATMSGRNERCDLAKRSCVLTGWRCTRTFFGNSGTRVRCRRGNTHARARWFYGS